MATPNNPPKVPWSLSELARVPAILFRLIELEPAAIAGPGTQDEVAYLDLAADLACLAAAARLNGIRSRRAAAEAAGIERMTGPGLRARLREALLPLTPEQRARFAGLAIEAGNELTREEAEVSELLAVPDIDGDHRRHPTPSKENGPNGNAS